MQPPAPQARLWHMSFQYIAIEGPIGVGKTSLAERLASRFDAAFVREEMENPFLADFYSGRPGAALQAQLFYLLNRHRQQLTLRQGDLFAQMTVADYLFDRDKIFAYLNLDDNELFIYQRLYELLARDVPSPDLVVYLQAPSDVLVRRVRDRAKDAAIETPTPEANYIRELNKAYQHFFFHYSATPLLVVETSQVDLAASDAAVDDLLRQIRTMNRGTGIRAKDVIVLCVSRPVIALAFCILNCGNLPHGLVQEGPQADGVGDGGKAEPRSGRPVGQMS